MTDLRMATYIFHKVCQWLKRKEENIIRLSVELVFSSTTCITKHSIITKLNS